MDRSKAQLPMVEENVGKVTVKLGSADLRRRRVYGGYGAADEWLTSALDGSNAHACCEEFTRPAPGC